MLAPDLRPGDVIRELGGVAIETPQQLEEQVEQARKESRKALLVLVTRNGQDHFLGLKLGVA